MLLRAGRAFMARLRFAEAFLTASAADSVTGRATDVAGRDEDARRQGGKEHGASSLYTEKAPDLYRLEKCKWLIRCGLRRFLIFGV